MEYPVRKLDQRETIQFKNWRNNDQFRLKLKLKFDLFYTSFVMNYSQIRYLFTSNYHRSISRIDQQLFTDHLSNVIIIDGHKAYINRVRSKNYWRNLVSSNFSIKRSARMD